MGPCATVAEAIRDGAESLRAFAEDPRREARTLLARALGVPRDDLIRDPHRTIDTAAFQALLARRQAREPMALILGSQGFWNLELEVGTATLIPRADSETVVETAIGLLRGRPPRRILDLGTGTGCLLLALLSEFPAAFGIGTDVSPGAAALAKRNANRLGFADRTAFACGNWADGLDGRFDLVVSNPPYIPAADIDTLMPEVALHEPRSALDGGADGLDAYRPILARLPSLLAPDGLGVMELGIGQAPAVAGMAAAAGLRASVHKDLGEIDRAIAVRSAGA